MCSISIVLIKSEKIHAMDDYITIKKNHDEDTYTISLRDRNEGNKMVYEKTGFSKSMTLDYIHVLLKSIEYDEDGYEKIQLNIPLIPRVYISSEEFKTDKSYQLFKMLSLGLDVMDHKCSHKSKLETEENKYTDMPPLISNDTRYFSRKNTHEYY